MKIRHHAMSVILSAAAGVFAAACASSPPPSVRMVASADIPAAEGTVRGTRAANDNTELLVEVRHLARPEKVSSQATTYVVWVRPSAGGAPQNMGALKVDKDLRGTLTTVTPLRSFDVFITVESSPTVTSPSRNLLSASIAR